MTTKTNEKATFEATVAKAFAEGWVSLAGGGDQSTVRATLKREGRHADERLSFTAWTSGEKAIHCVHATLATGQVSTRQVDRQWNSRITQAEMNEWLARRAFDNNSGFVLAVSEGEYTQYWETASNYTVHRLRPGRYPIELVTVDYQALDVQRYPKSAYYAIARVLTDEVRRHYINRVLTASSAHDETIDPPRPSSYLWAVYAYELSNRNGRNIHTPKFQVVPA